MLISHVSDEGGAGEGKRVTAEQDDSHEYQTANELFELMTKEHTFTATDEILSPSDLVILYKNIDLGTRLMSDATEMKRGNRRVETVVCNEEHDSESELSELCSTEDMCDVFLVNQERIDLLHSPSPEKLLCHKLGNLEMQTSQLSTDYDKHFVFQDPFIKEQLNSLKIMSTSQELDRTILPASILDYICCKQMEDNYTFYMESIIKYVTHTIEQLKRISNGDFLTDVAKQKWREVQRAADELGNNEKVLATSTSIPLHVERKVTGCTSLWDDIVHSEMDIRSLSKIMEKKIVLEIPKLISGSYTLFSKCCADNLVISCKAEASAAARDEKEKSSRVDVMFQLQRSDSGQVMSNINSIMILEAPQVTYESSLPAVMAGYTKIEVNPEDNVKVIELDKEDDLVKINNTDGECEEDQRKCDETVEYSQDNVFEDEQSLHSEAENDNQARLSPNFELINSSSESNVAVNDCSLSDNDIQYNTSSNSNNENYEFNIALKDDVDSRNNKEASFDITPNELRLTMQRLNIQSSLLEEGGEEMFNQKKKSLTRVRIKSPYENKSQIMEEKKRKRLLEIRERREKRKMVLNENSKIAKHKYNKGMPVPQPSSSVTKLSITNKSFYNSIYGQNANDLKLQMLKPRKEKKDALDVTRNSFDSELEASLLSPDANNKKYVNRSYFLDDAMTEVMRTELKPGEDSAEDLNSASTSSAPTTDILTTDFLNTDILSTDIHPGYSNASDMITPSILNLHNNNACTVASLDCTTQCTTTRTNKCSSANNTENCTISVCMKVSEKIHDEVPENTPRDTETEEDTLGLKKTASTIECRRNIDKIYDLMREMGRSDAPNTNSQKSNSNHTDKRDGGQERSTIQGSDSGTSLKHHTTFSEASEFSNEKSNLNNPASTKYLYNKMSETPSTTIPKVIISTKLQIPRLDAEKSKKEKDRKKVAFSGLKAVPENPLKAISHLLHEFDSVQKTRLKETEAKGKKKPDIIICETRNSNSRPVSVKRKSRLDQHQRNTEYPSPKNVSVTSRDRKLSAAIDILKIPHQQVPAVEKNVDRLGKKKISDILDEAKEARGEAVRGPPKSSRLNTLAQPKRSYVQAHSQEYRSKYGRNLMTDRLHRLAEGPHRSPEKIVGTFTRNKSKVPDVALPGLQKHQSMPATPSEIVEILRGSANCSPEHNSQLPLEASKKNNQIGIRDILQNKMVDVESYVKLHYGRVPPERKPLEMPRVVRNSRVPLVPTDIEIASTSSPLEEASSLGTKLHCIINTMFNDNLSTHTAPLKGQEVSKLNHERNELSIINIEDHSCPPPLNAINRVEIKTSEGVDIIKEETSSNVDLDKEDEPNYKIQSFNSETELQKLETALHRRISIGTFHKRLRLKNLTLTPKQSLQQVVVLQSGDTNSLILRTSLSQNLKTNYVPKSRTDLKTMPVLTKSHFGWSYSTIPMQIATVGYTFPLYDRAISSHISNMKSSENSIKDISTRLSSLKLDKKSQYQEQQVKLYSKENEEENRILVSGPSIPIIKPRTVIAEINEPATIKSDDHVSEAASKSDEIENVTSLDMLVTLLNEIQTITCQTLIANNGDNGNCKQLQCMLNDAAALENVALSDPQELVSIRSLDNLRQLDSSTSIYPLYLSNGDGHKTNEKQTNMTPRFARSAKSVSCNEKPLCFDKEIGVDIPSKLYKNAVTDVPSQFLPIHVNDHPSTLDTITNPLLAVLNQSTDDYQAFCAIDSFDSQPTPPIIIDVSPDEEKTISSKKSFMAHENVESPINNYDKLNTILIEHKTEPEQLKTFIKPKICKNVTEINYCVKTESDPLMKMKRDILVTVYSMLVLTVFAALSLPELLYRT